METPTRTFKITNLALHLIRESRIKYETDVLELAND